MSPFWHPPIWHPPTDAPQAVWPVAVRRLGIGLGCAALVALAGPATAEIAFARMDKLVPAPATQSPGEVFGSAPPVSPAVPQPAGNATMASKAAAAAAAVTAAVNGPRPETAEGAAGPDDGPLGVSAGEIQVGLPDGALTASTAPLAAPAAAAPECRDTASGARFCAVPMDRLEGRAAGWQRVAPPPPAYAVGAAFPIYDHNMLIDPTRYGLPPVTGPWRYYKTDTGTYRVSASDGTVLEVMPR
ncbi:hypothetical protein [Phaeovulum sp. W22_SRMD_FR3]|uniref:hypothetical protein n=1 Tax=Phaeovulum sp. W22_SRMD_FR3 TaxID=3240274 RepID=UPI003F9D2AE4